MSEIITIFVVEKEIIKRTDIMTNLFPTLLAIIIGIIALGVFVQSMKDLVVDTKWFRSTKMGMNYHNRLNKVEILTEEEYMKVWSGKMVDAE